MSIRILTLAGSLRKGSYNRKLADYIGKQLRAAPDVEVHDIDLAQYPLALYDANDEEACGIPAPALELHEAFRTSRGIFIASPEYNANVSPLLINVIAWVSRVKSDGGMHAAFGVPVFALGSASPGGFGGYRGLMVLRQSLELQLGARVLPKMVSIASAHEAFDESDGLKAERNQQAAAQVADLLVKAAGPSR